MNNRPVLFTALGAGVIVVLVAAGVHVFKSTLERIVVEQAERTSTAWAGYIGNSMSRIEDVAAGAF